MNTRLFALFGAALLAGVALGPAMAAAGSTAAANESLEVGVDGLTVGVTANGTAVAEATVDVSATDDNASYAGTGTYTTDANGTVALPAPNETVKVAITASADNRTAETSATLEATEETANLTFGQQVSAMVHQLQETTNGTGIGQAVSTFVVANNPGNAPLHAGGPGGPNATENSSQGPPAFVQSFLGNGDDNETVDDRRGPPAHAGGPDKGNETAADGNETDADANQSAGNGAGNGQGPPDHAGGGNDDSGNDDKGGGNGQGPPEHAGPGNDEADAEDE